MRRRLCLGVMEWRMRRRPEWALRQRCRTRVRRMAQLRKMGLGGMRHWVKRMVRWMTGRMQMTEKTRRVTRAIQEGMRMPLRGTQKGSILRRQKQEGRKQKRRKQKILRIFRGCREIRMTENLERNLRILQVQMRRLWKTPLQRKMRLRCKRSGGAAYRGQVQQRLILSIRCRITRLR